MSKFQIGDKVRVTAGVYAGNLGTVTEVTGDDWMYLPYYVVIDHNNGYWFAREELSYGLEAYNPPKHPAEAERDKLKAENADLLKRLEKAELLNLSDVAYKSLFDKANREAYELKEELNEAHADRDYWRARVDELRADAGDSITSAADNHAIVESLRNVLKIILDE